MHSFNVNIAPGAELATFPGVSKSKDCRSLKMKGNGSFADVGLDFNKISH